MKYREYLRSQRGVTPTGTIIFVIISALIFLFLLVVGRPFLFSLTYNSEVKTITRNSIKRGDASFIRRLKEGARERNFKLKESDIIITRGYNDDTLAVKLTYYYDLELPHYSKTLKFQTATEQTIASVPGSGEKKGIKAKQKKTEGFFKKIKEFFF